MIFGYELEQLTDEERERFELHLLDCPFCTQEVLDGHAFANACQAAIAGHIPHIALPVTSIHDRRHVNLTDEYAGKTRHDTLAAASGPTDAIAFPVTLHYHGEDVVGQFRKRAGHLFYRLETCRPHPSSSRYLLLYTPSHIPLRIRTFEVSEEAETRLGPVQEFIAAETRQGILEAFRRFYLVISSPEKTS